MNPARPFLQQIASSSRSSLRSRHVPGTLPLSACPSRTALRRSMATTREQYFRNKSTVGPFSFTAAGLFVATGVGLYFYFVSEKAKVQERKQEEFANKSYGRPQIGGPFSLLSTTRQTFTEQDLLGKWSLIYFGFTHCPDICPEELDKMGQAVDMVEKQGKGADVLPIFISVDPARDTVEQVEKYVLDFHPKLVGLTGDYEGVKRACKSYRVYFSTPPGAKATDDYLVDHSIFFYLMDPLGQFVDAFGKNTSAAEVAAKLTEAQKQWEKAGGDAVARV